MTETEVRPQSLLKGLTNEPGSNQVAGLWMRQWSAQEFNVELNFQQNVFLLDDPKSNFYWSLFKRTVLENLNQDHYSTAGFERLEALNVKQFLPHISGGWNNPKLPGTQK